MWSNNKVLAVIPARGGSKSIPRKNLAQLNNVSLVGRAIKFALSLTWVDQVILSTDDEEIADEGKIYGLHVPFMRPKEFASDTSNSIEMWRQVWLQSEVFYGVRFDYSILLEPTSPLRNIQDIEKTMQALTFENHASAVTVSQTPAHYTPHKTLVIESSGRVNFFLNEGINHSIRQSIPPYYHRNGICYAVKRNTLIEKKSIFTDDTIAVLIDRDVVNIDNPIDLKLAEILICEKEKLKGD